MAARRNLVAGKELSLNFYKYKAEMYFDSLQTWSLHDIVCIYVIVRGTDGLSMVHGPPSFRQHEGFGRFVREFLCEARKNLVAYYNVKCDLIITVSLQRDTASLFSKI